MWIDPWRCTKMTLDSNDKKIEPGKRTAFCVYLVDGGTDPKYQDVPFGCTLKKLSIYFDSTCACSVVIAMKIDDKVVAKGRGKDSKVEFDLDDPIYPNSRVWFGNLTEGGVSGWKALIYGEVVCQ